MKKAREPKDKRPRELYRPTRHDDSASDSRLGVGAFGGGAAGVIAMLLGYCRRLVVTLL